MDREIEKLYRAVDALNEWVRAKNERIKILEEELAHKDEQISRLGLRFIEDLKGGEVITWRWVGTELRTDPVRFLGHSNGWIVYQMASWEEGSVPLVVEAARVENLQKL